MKNLSNNSNGKNKVAIYLTRVTLTFAFTISCAVLTQAQINPIQTYLERQKREQQAQVIRDFIYDMTIRREARERERNERFKQTNPIVLPPLSVQQPLLSSQTNSILSPKTPVVITSALTTPVPTGNLSPVNSQLQSIPSLDMAGDLGNGVVILKDAAGKLYSLRITNAVNAGRSTPARKQSRARRVRP
jgi:hypothetical protein